MIKINNITKAMRSAKMKEEDLIELNVQVQIKDGVYSNMIHIDHVDYSVSIHEGSMVNVWPKKALTNVDEVEGLKSKFAIFSELANIELQKDLSGVKTEVKKEQPVIESVEVVQTPQIGIPTETLAENLNDISAGAQTIDESITKSKTPKPKAKDFWGQHYTQTEWYKFDKETRKVMLDQMKAGTFVKPADVVIPAEQPAQVINPQVQVPGVVENIEVPVQTPVAETQTVASTPTLEVPKLIIPGLE